MDKETLRMQMLAGVITEGQYKAKLEEIGVGAVLGGAAIAALAKKAYGAYKNYALKKGMKETGEEKKGSNGIIAKEYMSEKDGKTYWGITYQDDTRDSGYEKPRMFLFTPEKIDKVLNTDLKFATSDEDMMADGADEKLGQFIADKVVMLEGEKDSLNESMIGGIVGLGAINQIPPRAKADYEDAFEHFLGQKYELKEEINEDEKPSKEELEKAIQQLMAIGWDRRDAENLVYGHMEEGKEVEEGKVNENMLAVGDNVRITAPLDADTETDEGTIAKVYPNFDSIPSEDIGYYEVDADAYDESALNSPWYKVDQDGEEMLYAAEELELN
jgi:hypothetical protein